MFQLSGLCYKTPVYPGSSLRVLWTGRRSNQLILKEINHEYSSVGLERTEAETPVLWPPDVKSQLIRKDPDPGKD